MEVKIYTTPTCGYCHMAKEYLTERGVSYTEYDVSRDRSLAEEMVRVSGQMGVPVIVVDGQVIVGFNRGRLEQLLAAGAGKRAHLGIKVADAGNKERKPGEPPLFGAVVGAVSAGSPGDRARLMPGDIITSINQKRVNNTAELEELVGKLTPGSRVPVIFYRRNEAKSTEIAL